MNEDEVKEINANLKKVGDDLKAFAEQCSPQTWG